MSNTPTTVLPSAGTWIIDPSHSSLEFVARHLMVSKVRGRFVAFTGTVEVADPVEGSSVEVVIESASFDSGEAQRDGHVKSGDFLDVEQFPTITFKGSGARAEGEGYVLSGHLTIRETTLPVDLKVEALGVIADPWGNEKAAFSASTEIDRAAFGITWNTALETGGVLVGNRVVVELDIQLARQA